jgi:hypothetical protein
MLDHTDQDEPHATGKSRRDLECAPYRALDMAAVTPAAEDCSGKLDRTGVNDQQRTSRS